MDRNREARRGSMAAAAVNGSSGLSRRRQRRTSNLRDSTDEDGGMELQEPSRLRDRGVKKDRDRDRERSSSRSKRRRGERLMHESSNRGEGDDSSDESMDEEDGDEDDEVGVRLPLQGNSSSFPPSTSSQQHSHNHHNQSLNHFRKSNSFLGSNNNISKPVRPSAQLMKVSEEMIGVSIPRKARSSMKRPQEYSGTGEPIHHRQDSASPARHSPSSNTATSPPSSNLSIRKKKSISGSKHRPPKMAKSPPVSSTIQEIEIAEVLFGMTRQAPLPVVDKQETNKVETKDDNPNGLNAEAKSRVSSPNSVSQTQASSQQQSVLPMKVSAPKRKRPRLRLEEESPTSSVAATSAKIEAEMASKMEEVTSPRSKKNHVESGTVDNETGSSDPSKDCVDNQKELVKQESSNQGIESREEVAIKEKVGILGSNFVDKNEEKVVSSGADKSVVVKEGPQKARLSIDLMAPPSIMDKSTSDKDGLSDFSSDQKDTGSEKKLLPFSDIDKSEKTLKNEGMSDHQNVGNFLSKGFDLKQQQQQVPKEKLPDLHLNLDKHDKEGGLSLGCNGSKQLPFPKQQQKTARVDHKQEKQAPTASMPLPVPIAGWPSGFPSFGYMGQVPPLQAVVPLDGSSLAPNTIQPPNFIQPQQQLKRCATHCYIARNIHSHQQFARMTNPFWAAAAAVGASGTPLYGTKYNLNAVPPSESTAAILGNPLQAGFPPVSLSTLQEKSAPKEMSSTNATAVTNSNLYLDAAAAHRKQFLLQQSSQPGSSATPPTMISGPTIIFPINQQSSVANQPGPALKSTPGASGVTATTPPATIANTTATPSVSFNYAGMNPNDARCMAFMQSNAILQNNAYPFSMAAAAAAAAAQAGSPTPYKGANPAQAMPFFNGPFYSPQMVPSQQQMQLGQHMMQQQQMQRQQIHQQQQQESSSAAQPPRNNSSTSSGSSSSQKHTQQAQQRVLPGSGIAAGVSNTHNFQTSLKQQPLNLMSRQARQLENETAREGSPSSTGDNIRLSHQAQKSVYGQSFAMPKMPPQNFALISPATAATAMVSSGANRNDKQQQQNQHHALKELTPSQVYAMSFASFGGPATAGGPSFDFSNIVQNPALLQNLPEVTRHGYQIPAAAAAATQHKKTQHEDAKSVGDSGTSNKASSATDEAKTATTANKQQSLNFSRPDNDHAMTNIITNLADASSRPSTAGSRPLNPPSYSAAPSSAAAANPSSFNMSPKSQQQYYQHVIEFQRQQQQRMHFLQQQQQQQQKLPASNRQNAKPGTSPMAAPNNSSSSVNNPTSVSSSMAPNRFPPLSVLQQGSGSSGASHSPQWKPSTPSNNRQSMTPIAAASSNSSSSAKNQILQQQQQLHHQQQAQQISFGGVGLSSSNKPATNQSVAPLNVGSPQSSISKSSAAAAATGGGNNGGSPRAAAASSDLKSLPPPSIQHQQQMIAAAAAAKHSQTAAGSSNLKPSSPITTTTNNSNRNLNSMLGHPQMASAPSNSTNNKNNKVHPQKQQQQQMQKQQQQNFQQPQIFFNSPYIHQAQQNTQSNAKSSTASGMLSLSSSLILAGGSSAGAASDPAKAAAGAGSNKGMANTQQQQAAAAQYAAATAAATSMAPHPFMPAYPYMHAMQTPAVSNKTATTAADKKQQQSTTGQGENAHASWKPEKR